MRVLLSTIGSRGDVQPLVALALALGAGPGCPPVRAARLPRLDRGPRLPVTPIGPDVRKAAAASPPVRRRPRPSAGVNWRKARSPRSSRPSPRRRRAATSSSRPRALQIAARSVAERWAFPTSSPPTARSSFRRRTTRRRRCRCRADAGTRAADNASSGRGTRSASTTCSAPRSTPTAPRSGSPRSTTCARHVFTDQPWLAADPTLGALARSRDAAVFQTGAWICRTSVRCSAGDGGVPRRRRPARLLRLRQHARAAGPRRVM